MKVSIITATYNSAKVLPDCLRSLNNQSYKNIEHIVVDGASSDNTVDLINQSKSFETKVISEKDKGIYDALNKGVALATGDIIGILHSDDFLAHAHVIARVVEEIEKGFDGCYSDLNYVYRNNTDRVFRHWKAGVFDKFQLKLGWMPPHPSLFIKKEVYQQFSEYNLEYKISADYDFLLKLFNSDFKISYIPETLICMKVGGESNKSLKNLLKKFQEDYKIASHHNSTPLMTIFSKMARKVPQLFTMEAKK